MLSQLPGRPAGTLPSEVPPSQNSTVKFMSFQMTACQTRYHTTEREFLAVLLCWEKARYLVCGSDHPVKLYTDHTAVKDILRNGDAATGRIARWQHRFGEFNYEVMHVPAKQVAVADVLSRLGKFPYTVRECDFPTVVSCSVQEETLKFQRHRSYVEVMDRGFLVWRHCLFQNPWGGTTTLYRSLSQDCFQSYCAESTPL